MAFTKSLWTKKERQDRRKKTVIIAIIILAIFLIVGVIVYFKKTNTNTVSTTEGVKLVKELEKEDINSIENAIEDRRSARDKKNAKLNIEDDDTTDEDKSDESAGDE